MHCHAGCEQGAILTALRRIGLLARDAAPRPRAPMRNPGRNPGPTEPRDWSGAAQLLWDNGTPIAGTVVARYLQARGCGDVKSEALRCLSRGILGPHPCMMALVSDVVTARPISLHLTRLNPDGTAKADVERPKLLLTGHRKSGGCIRLSPDDEVTLGLGLAEGIETALAVMRIGYAPIWATVDAGNLKNFPVLGGIEALSIYADHDAAGMEAAKACLARWSAAGRETRIQFPLGDGWDFADLNLSLHGPTLNPKETPA